MAQPFGVGDVVGGRYRVTHHVVTSADQDIVFQAHDQVLDREVSILLASRSNAKQVATSARELAIGERDSDAHVLDLGLADDRTYLISSLVDPNHLLDLVVPDTAPYVEPFFTDSLGSELFGQSRVMEPETYDDDAEYYAGLHAHRNPTAEIPDDERGTAGSRFRRKRPAFLDKVSDSLNKRLGTDRRHPEADEPATGTPDAEGADPEVPGAGVAGAAGAAQPGGEQAGDEQAGDAGVRADHVDEEFGAERPHAGARLESPPSASQPDGAAGADSTHTGHTARAGHTEHTGHTAHTAHTAGAGAFSLQSDREIVDASPAHDTAETFTATAEAARGQRAAQHPHDGEEVVDNPPPGPVDEVLFSPQYGGPTSGLPESADTASAPGAAASSFTGLISAVPPEQHPQQPDGSAEAASASPGAGAGAGVGAAAATAGAGSGSAAPPASGDTDFADQRPGKGRWLAAAGLAVLVLVAAVLIFTSLNTGGNEQTQDTAGDQQEDPSADGDEQGNDEQAGDEQGGDESSDSGDDASDSPAVEVAEVTRIVPDSPELLVERDGDLANLTDGDESTGWNSYTFATSDFGGFASNLVLAFELEDPTSVSSLTIAQDGSPSGGEFDVLVNDSPTSGGAQTVGTGSWDSNEVTLDVDDSAEGSYVMINVTELPEQSDPVDSGLPYSLQLTEISLD